MAAALGTALFRPSPSEAEASTVARPRFVGVNLSGAEFSSRNLPGVYGTHYRYPAAAEIDYFTSRGFNALRLPFRWERLQPNLGEALDQTELGRIQEFVDHATAQHALVVLDPHNYARRGGQIIGSPGLPDAQFADFWRRLAAAFKDKPLVAFGLMNEPHDQPADIWRNSVDVTVRAIRDAHASNIILVPGVAWTGAHSWFAERNGLSNAQAFDNFSDPGRNFAFEFHQYFDQDSSGTHQTCLLPDAGAAGISRVTQWLAQRGAKGFLGEFGASTDASCLSGMESALQVIAGHCQSWLGWTCWGGGARWRNYFMGLGPQENLVAPQLAILEHYAGAPACARAS